MRYGLRSIFSFIKIPSASYFPARLGVLGGTRIVRSMSQVPKEIEDELRSNPYYEKYANKIHELQKTSPEDFMSRVEQNQNRKMKPKFGLGNEKSFSIVGKAKENLGANVQEPVKTKALSDVMKTDLIEGMGAEEVSQIWNEYFKHKDGISATIPIELYNRMYEKGKKYPIFVLPLPRGEGYEFFLCQTSGHEVHFTPLINYQAHKENAPECLTVVHYTEVQDKGIVLMHGEYNKDVLDGKEALCLANQFQLYYGQENEKRLNLLERLNYNPAEFKYMDLIAELENFSL